MARELEQLQDSRAKNLQPFFWTIFGYLLTAYCVLRAVSVRAAFLCIMIFLTRVKSAYNLAFGSNVASTGPSSPDIIAQAFAFVALYHAEVQVDADALAYHLSLIFVGVIIAINIRTVLRECVRVGALVSSLLYDTKA